MRRRQALKVIREALIVYPGDTLIVRVDRCSQDQAFKIKEQLSLLVPEVKTVVLGVDEIAVVRGQVTR